MGGLLKSKAEGVAIASLIISLAIVGVKLFVAMITGSIVVLAELLDSIGDILTSSVTWIGVRLSRKPPDATHPYGHAKVDSLLGLLSSFVLIEVGIYIIYRSVTSLLNPIKPPTVTQGAFYLLIATSIINVARSLSLWMIGRPERSRILVSEAINYGWDAVRTSLVVGVLWLSSSLPWLDPLSALVASLIFIPSAIKVSYWSANDLLDRIDPSVTSKIEEALKSCEDVVSVRRVRARYVGGSLLIDAVVEIDPKLTTYNASDLLERLARRLEGEFGATDVMIVPAVPNRESMARRIAESVEGVRRAHSIEFRERGKEVSLHIILGREVGQRMVNSIMEKVKSNLKRELGVEEVIIHVDGLCNE